jgi:hypothetical protein
MFATASMTVLQGCNRILEFRAISKQAGFGNNVTGEILKHVGGKTMCRANKTSENIKHNGFIMLNCAKG